MARSRHSLVLIVAALLGMLAQLGPPRTLAFMLPRTGPRNADSSTAAETYMALDANNFQDHRAAAANDNSLLQGCACASRVCATVMLTFALLLGVLVPPSQAVTAEQLVREALKRPRGAVQQQTPAPTAPTPAPTPAPPAPPAEKPVEMPVQAQKQIETAPTNRQTDTDEEAKKVFEKPLPERAAVFEDAAQKQKETAEKLLKQEQQKEKAAANLQKLQQKKSAERMIREALENAKEEKIKKSAEPKEKQDEELKKLAEQRAREKEQDEKQEALRLKILGDLQKRKADAEKAAAEAEAIAEKIEQLAKDARKAALAAKEMASALR